MDDICKYHTEFVKDIAILKENSSYIRNKLSKHVEEGEKEGGYRDQLRDTVKDMASLKIQISEIKKGYWKSGIIGGAVVGLILKSPELGRLALTLIAKIVFAMQ